MMKKTISVLLAFLMLLALTVSASANSIISYKDWNVCFAPGDDIAFYVASCKLNDSEITIPDSFDGVRIVGINENAFISDDNLISVTFNPYITVIGKYAFFKCTSLTTVQFNSALTKISDDAFESTTSLVNINLEDTQVVSIGKNAFLNSGIKRIALPETCTTIYDDAFAQCASLTKITIPAGVTSIGNSAFRGSENVVIYCTSDSYAHAYAVENDIPFVLTDVPTEVTFILGDADGDGSISVLDATKIQRVLVELDDDPDGMIALRGAVDGDEKLNVMHATSIQRYLADYYTAEPIGTEVTRSILLS